jgi:asparagine synthase (glutamine-hydrolysing)
MCGIAGIVSLNKNSITNLSSKLKVMSNILIHRGPDGNGQWLNKKNDLGFIHRRLAIIDLSEISNQPMIANNSTVITYNGEVYNYKELQKSLGKHWMFKTNSDTECILAAYDKFEDDCVNYLRGMFAFALWDEKKQRLLCARDRFGIKPFYYCIVDNIFYFASEAKALLPFLPSIKTNEPALAEYLTFQYTIGEKTLFEGINQLLPGHILIIKDGKINVKKYWDISYNINYEDKSDFFYKKINNLFHDSVLLHCRSDVPVGSYISGGVDSSLVFNLAQRHKSSPILGFHGKFTEYPGYDESLFAKIAINNNTKNLHIIDIKAEDFEKYFEKVIYHLDFPTAGPGSFSQFMVSKLVAEYVKVVLGGQGGDEIFGGYARYVIAYLEQSLKAAIDGTYKNGNFVVTIESIIPNLGLLREYKPLLKKFWSKNLFNPMDERYFSLVERTSEMDNVIEWKSLNMSKVKGDFSVIFNNPNNVNKDAYFDKMTHFDFKCLLPALLQVEDRMSMAHGIESRVPFLDHPLVEFAATIPANVKFKGGKMKNLIKEAFAKELPVKILQRRDKMGFPVPLKEWSEGKLKNFITNILDNMIKKKRPFINCNELLKDFNKEDIFSRKIWSLISLEIWYQQFHDKSSEWKNLATKSLK